MRERANAFNFESPEFSNNFKKLLTTLDNLSVKTLENFSKQVEANLENFEKKMPDKLPLILLASDKIAQQLASIPVEEIAKNLKSRKLDEFIDLLAKLRLLTNIFEAKAYKQDGEEKDQPREHLLTMNSDNQYYENADLFKSLLNKIYEAIKFTFVPQWQEDLGKKIKATNTESTNFSLKFLNAKKPISNSTMFTNQDEQRINMEKLQAKLNLFKGGHISLNEVIEDLSNLNSKDFSKLEKNLKAIKIEVEEFADLTHNLESNLPMVNRGGIGSG